MSIFQFGLRSNIELIANIVRDVDFDCVSVHCAQSTNNRRISVMLESRVSIPYRCACISVPKQASKQPS